MMRIANLTYNEAKECSGSGFRDEKQVSTYILSFQIAHELIKKNGGHWAISLNDIVLHLNGLNDPITIEYTSGTIHYGTLTTLFYNRYAADKGVSGLVKELCSDLAITLNDTENNPEFLFRVFVKLVEIFHARCDLRITPGKNDGEWEIKLSEQGPYGWVSEDYIAENRFGEKMDISQWEKLRSEKAAAYIFGFNRFCKNFQCPMK